MPPSLRKRIRMTSPLSEDELDILCDSSDESEFQNVSEGRSSAGRRHLRGTDKRKPATSSSSKEDTVAIRGYRQPAVHILASPTSNATWQSVQKRVKEQMVNNANPVAVLYMHKKMLESNATWGIIDPETPAGSGPCSECARSGTKSDCIVKITKSVVGVDTIISTCIQCWISRRHCDLVHQVPHPRPKSGLPSLVCPKVVEMYEAAPSVSSPSDEGSCQQSDDFEIIAKPASLISIDPKYILAITKMKGVVGLIRKTLAEEGNLDMMVELMFDAVEIKLDILLKASSPHEETSAVIDDDAIQEAIVEVGEFNMPLGDLLSDVYKGGKLPYIIKISLSALDKSVELLKEYIA